VASLAVMPVEAQAEVGVQSTVVAVVDFPGVMQWAVQAVLEAKA
jgi:hypothetical protein